jgi:hypothetical protein
MQQCQRVGLVVVGRLEPARLQRRDHRLLVGVPLAGDVPLDGAHRHALVRNAVGFRPGGEVGEIAAVGVAGRCSDMPPHLLEHHHADAARGLVDLLQPGAEAQPDHAAALEPAGAELVHAAGNRAVAVAHRPASALA